MSAVRVRDAPPNFSCSVQTNEAEQKAAFPAIIRVCGFFVFVAQLPDHDVSEVLSALADVIESRKGGDPQKSYVAKLFSKAPDGVLKKIGEEAVECVMAAKDENKKDIIYETADLWFHSLVMLSQYGLRPEHVLAELERREGLSGLEEKRRRFDPSK